jgi:hypothetical protein
VDGRHRVSAEHKALFWSAVINGVAAVPIMVMIMLMAVMGQFTRAAFRNHLVLAHISSGSSASVALARRKSADTARRSASASAVCSPCL